MLAYDWLKYLSQLKRRAAVGVCALRGTTTEVAQL